MEREETTDQSNACFICGNVGQPVQLETSPFYPYNEVLICISCHFSKKLDPPSVTLPNKPIYPKNYRCEICDKRFQFDSFLQRHKKMHSEVKEFKCPQCGRCYKYRGNLNVHLKVCTGPDITQYNKSMSDQL